MSDIQIPNPDKTILDNLLVATPKQKEFISGELLSYTAKKLSEYDHSKGSIINLIRKIPYNYVVGILSAPDNKVEKLVQSDSMVQLVKKEELTKEYFHFVKSIPQDIAKSKLMDFFKADQIIKDHPSFKHLFHNNGNDRIFIVTGKVTYANGTIPVAEQLLVLAYYVNPPNPEKKLGKEAQVDPNGYYNIQYSSKEIPPSGQNQSGPNLCIRVLDRNSGKVIAISELFHAKIDHKVEDIIIKEKLQPPSNLLVVSGRVKKKDGTAIPEVTVIAIDKDLRNEQELGRTKTNESGYYEISYTREQFTREEKESADLLIRAQDSAGAELQLEQPPPIKFNAPPNTLIDLTIKGEFREPSEYDQLLSEIKPLLDGTELTELTEDDKHQDITFLAGETEQDKEHIEFVILAHKLAAEAGMRDIKPEVFYGFLRQKFPRDLLSILARNQDDQRAALNKAVEKNIIPSNILKSIDQVFHQLEQLRSVIDEQNINDRAVKNLTSLLKTSKLLTSNNNTLLNKFLDNYKNTIKKSETDIKKREDLWKGINEEQKKDIQITLLFDAFTNSDIKLVEQLQKQRKEDLRLNFPRDLVKLDDRKWRELIRSIPGIKDEEKRNKENNIKSIIGAVKSAFPTGAVYWELFKEKDKPDAMFENKLQSNIVKFFENSPDFDFRDTHIDEYLQKHKESAFKDIENKKEVRDNLIKELKGLQRIFRVTQDYKEIKSLKKKGFDSAFKIAYTPKSAFINNYGKEIGENLETENKDLAGEIKAENIHDTSVKLASAALAICAKCSPSFNLPIVNAISSSSKKSMENASDAESTRILQGIFGSLDLCDCKHCRSVLSPAAYFVDLMKFLQGSPVITDPKNLKHGNALDILLQRRPDLEFIELSCENTNKTLPYIDLVNEILEIYIAASSSPTTTTTTSTSNSSLHNQIPEQVLINEVSRNYSQDTLDKKLICIRSDGKREELSSNPEYLNTEAYRVLTGSIYPFDMPFNIWVEEMRVYLEHLHSSRYQLMDTFRKEKENMSISEKRDIASEYLKMTYKEIKDIILKVSTANIADLKLWKFYGYKDSESNNWVENLSVVKTFLKRTGGLTYQQLIELLSTRFINPPTTDANRKVQLDPAGKECDTNNKIENIGGDTNYITLRKILIFIRLWKKIGWSIPQLDKVFNAFKVAEITDINNLLIQKLACIKKVKSELDLPLVKILSFWSNIDTKEWWDEPIDIIDKGKAEEDYHISDNNSGRLSLYNSLFQNRTVKNPPDEKFKLNNERTQLASYNQNNNDNPIKVNDNDVIPTILAALNISSKDLSSLIVNGSVIGSTDNKLNLENLSILYRHTLLSKALNLSIVDFVSLKSIIGVDPFAFDENNIENILLFIDKIKKIRQSDFTINDLNYIIRHRYDRSEERDVYPTEKDIFSLLSEIVDGQKKILNQIQNEQDPPGRSTALRESFVKQKLSNYLKLDVDITNLLITSLIKSQEDGNSSRAAIADFIDNDFINRYYNVTSNTTNTTTNVNSSEFAKQFRYIYLLHKVSLLVTKFKITKDELNFLSVNGSKFGNFNLNTILVELNPGTSATSTSAITNTTSTTSASVTTTTSANFSFTNWERLYDIFNLKKIMSSETLSLFDVFRFANTFDIQTSQVKNAEFKKLLGLVLHNISSINTIVNILEGGTSSSTLQIEEKRSHIRDLLGRLLLTQDANEINDSRIDMLIDSSPNRKNERFAFILLKLLEYVLFKINTGWTMRDLRYLIEKSGLFRLTSEEEQNNTLAQKIYELLTKDFANETHLIRLKKCFDIIRQVGVPAEKLLNCSKAEINPDDLLGVKQALKAKYNNDNDWLEVSQSINNTLREKRRSALISYLVWKRGFEDSNKLFEYFLIDTEMGACQKTSRIKQAISTIQLFVQRCLMKLEETETNGVRSDVIIDDSYRKWMKNYRVWEANRKVFLHPENYIEPDLRDNKSPFFKDLENELLQKEITSDSVEQALINYLEKLDEVSRLEICGVYYEKDDEEHEGGRIAGGSSNNEDVIHVFGRTFVDPRIYYYRKFMVRSNYWTAWEKVDVEIEGDHLIPVVYNRRLHIFWPIFTEKQEPSHTDTYNETGPEGRRVERQPKKYWEIKIAWSEYKNNKWSTKKVSSEVVDYFLEEQEARRPRLLHLPTYPREEFNFKASISSANELTIRILHFGPLTPYDNALYNSVYAGEFRISGCRGGLSTKHLERVEPAREPKMYAVLVPKNSVSRYMTFKHNTGSTTLELPTKMNTTDLALQPVLTTLLLDDLMLETNSDSTFEDGRYGEATINEIRPVLSTHPYTTVLEKETPPSYFPYTITYHHQYEQFVSQAPFFYQDRKKTFFVKPKTQYERYRDIRIAQGIFYQFDVFYHPYVCEFTKKVSQYGISKLLTLENQISPVPNHIVFNFGAHYIVNSSVAELPNREKDHSEIVDFEYDGSYSLYNWELFFHLPLLVASKLGNNQKFEEAQKWFHYIFNPTKSSDARGDRRYWNFKPLYDNVDNLRETISDLMRIINYRGRDREKLRKKKEMLKQIEEWIEHPFNPDLIARLRMSAYGKTVVMKYIDNLIAWGDYLFKQETIESINEATLLYILAYNILGKRPERMTSRLQVTPVTIYDSESKRNLPATYYNLKDKLDTFSNAIIELENQFPFDSRIYSSSTNGNRQEISNGAIKNDVAIAQKTAATYVGDDILDTNIDSGSAYLLGLGFTFFFCIPQNEKLRSYWDTISDRLFKIRHCMNIEGVVRQLPLFEPPIDPSLLVRARAMGVDIRAALNDLNVAVPHYRFIYLVQKALELCSDLKSLGNTLLSALEKKDVEELSLIRAQHEHALLTSIKQIKEKQIEEANNTKKSLDQSKKLAEKRLDHYINLRFMNPSEQLHLAMMTVSWYLQTIGQVAEMGAAGSYSIPNALVGGAGWASSPVAIAQYGGSNVGNSMEAFAKAMSIFSSYTNLIGNMSSTMAGYQRRQEEWDLQRKLASIEIQQIEAQIEAAKIRSEIARKELENHDKQIEQSTEIENFLKNKFTNKDLYSWMVSQISTIYFQSYQMAYDLAKKAEKAYQFETGIDMTTTSNFITFGYWDNMKKGLLSGERLYNDLKRLEISYLDYNKRDYEITKNISLAMVNPEALISLKEKGECEFTLPEWLFDLDYPGHYMRRIKTVSITIPCITGPYTNINCTLRLLGSVIRTSKNPGNQYRPLNISNDSRFKINFTTEQSIATSYAQNDPGLFELSFRDERYLPFEGAGAADSQWQLVMPKECNNLDFDTISDVILKISYSAKDGGEILGNSAKADFIEKLRERQLLKRMFSSKHEFSAQWSYFLNPRDNMTSHILELDLSRERFPFHFDANKSIRLRKISVYPKFKQDINAASARALQITLVKRDERPQSDGSDRIPITGQTREGGVIEYAIPNTDNLQNNFHLKKWSLEVNRRKGDPDRNSSIPAALRKKKIVDGQETDDTITQNSVQLYTLRSDVIEDIGLVCDYNISFT